MSGQPTLDDINSDEDDDLGKRVCDWTDEIAHNKKRKISENVLFKTNEELAKEWIAKLSALGFRKYPVYPTSEELDSNHKPAIRSNIVTGKYEDIEQYLDIQYTLLREDFVKPMRKCITEYKKAIKNGYERPIISGVHIYQNVIIREKCAEAECSYFATFEDFDLGPKNSKVTRS